MMLGCDAVAVVDHINADEARLAAGGNRDRAATGGVLAGII